jgi:hypothetical protein
VTGGNGGAFHADEREQRGGDADVDRAQRAAERAGYSPPGTRPDKRARRLIRALGDLDSL